MDLLNEFYRDGEGLAYNPQARVATFKTLEAAHAFKAIAPNWTVQYEGCPHVCGTCADTTNREGKWAWCTTRKTQVMGLETCILWREV